MVGIKKTATRHILRLPVETKARRGDGEYGRLYEALLKVRRRFLAENVETTRIRASRCNTEVHLSVALAFQ